jgi:L-ascorbate metabolism protein UlaG (beta-lactamase superfamily)
MKITKFAQSCLLIETAGKKILIDPGNIQYQETYPNNEWSNVDIILITHKHSDHCHLDGVKELLKNPQTKLYTSNEVANAYPELTINIVKEGDILTFDDLKIEVTKAVHGWVPAMKGTDFAVKENIGFIIDDGKTRAYQTSDTLCFDNDYKCDVICLPFVNHGVVMGPTEAAKFAEMIGVKLVIPIHYDNPKYPGDFEWLKKEFAERNLNYKFLEIGENIEI